jgi:hypothetical protein
MNKDPKHPKLTPSRQIRAIMWDRSKRPLCMPPAEEIEQLLNQLVRPAIFNLIGQYQALGLRARTLSLPVMSCFLISLLWRQCGSVTQAVRELNQHGLLWQPPLKVSQQALSQRLRELPAELFEMVLTEIIPQLQQRWHTRTRPINPAVKEALTKFNQVLAVDGSGLDALIKKVGLIPEQEGTVLAGKMVALLDVGSQLPTKVWYGEDSNQSERRWWEQIEAHLPEGSLVLFDLGFLNYERFEQLSHSGKYFISRVKTRMFYKTIQELKSKATTAAVKERLIEVSTPRSKGIKLRMVEVEYEGKWYSYLTNVLNQADLAGEQVASLYRQRWRIEDAFKTVKRLLGLAYFYGSSINAVMLQMWTSWLMYSILVDLSDALAEELKVEQGRISLEMVYRGLYDFSRVKARGEAAGVIEYLAKHAKLLGLVKRLRNKPIKT